ncbi:hypothetical protein B0H34DRAFT_223031 [Crassisporium funariophilum]|nr:hypothetical protein B0H34DRAFT_223031 [Crassisporium funariophilum]
MNFTNINDAAGVAALLDQLKSSTAWQELANNTTPALPPPSQAPPPPESGDTNAGTENISNISPVSGTSVASLLSQLKPFSPGPSRPTGDPRYHGEVQHVQAAPTQVLYQPELLNHSRITPEAQQDVKNFTFQQALPVISRLADDPSVISAVKKMKTDQNELERSLWADREAIYRKYHEKLKIAQTRANMVGTTISQHELDMVTDAFKKEISRFDHDRVIPAWDGLLSRQQQELEHINVPRMFVTNEVQTRETQQQVVSVLESIVASKWE